MRFKVGDKVRIRKDLEVNKMYGWLNLLPEKATFKGRTATVIYATDCEYTLDVDGGKWSWNDEMLETTEQPQMPRAFIQVGIDKQQFIDTIRKRFEELAGLESSDEPDELPGDEPDMIQKPPHYNQFSFQPIDVIDEVTNYYEGSTAFHIGTVLKYLCRAPFKGKLLEDLKKANYYLTRAIEEMEEDGE